MRMRALAVVMLLGRLAGADTDIVIVDTIEKARDLCAATRPADRAKIEGDAVQRGMARRDHEERRETLMQTPHAVAIPSAGFVLGEFDAKERELPLDTKKVWRALNGALSIYAAAGADDLALEKVDEAAARAIADAKKAGRGQLVLVFLPAVVDEGPCVSSAGGKALTLAVEPLILELLDGDKSLSRTETPEYQEFLASLPPPSTGTPVVDVTGASVENAPASQEEVRRRVSGVRRQLEGCYEKGLKDKPALGGTVVLGFTVGKDGKAREVEPIADSLLSQPVTDCAAGVVAAVAFPSAREPARATVTLSFTRRRSPK